MRTRVLAGGITLFVTVLALAQQVPPTNLSAKTTIAQKSEPGERLLVSGTLYDSAGKTPLANVILYAYQTDATGVYSKPVDDSRNPRLKGWVKTDSQGRFELDTIKPGSYPGGGIPLTSMW